MGKLKLIKSPYTQEERIQARIDSFRKEFMAGDGEMEQVEEYIDVILEYLAQYDDPMLDQAFVRMHECKFWLSAWMEY